MRQVATLEQKRKKMPIKYMDLNPEIMGELPKLKPHEGARTIYSDRERENGALVYRGIQVNKEIDFGFEKEFYSEYLDMVEEIYDRSDELSEYDFGEMMEVVAHEGFHQLQMFDKVNKKYGHDLENYKNIVSEEEEGYAFLFGKTMKHMAILAESERYEHLADIYSEALNLAKEEIELTKESMEKGGQAEGMMYQEYILPAYKISHGSTVENLIPYAQEFMESIKNQLPEKYHSQNVNFLEHDLDFSRYDRCTKEVLT